MAECAKCHGDFSSLRISLESDPFTGADCTVYYCQNCHPEGGAIFNYGTKVRLNPSGLISSPETQGYIDFNGVFRLVNWGEYQEKHLNEIGTVIDPGYAILKYEVVVLFDNTDRVLLHPDWLEKIEDVCKCPLNTLMAKGCVCGHLTRYKSCLI